MLQLDERPVADAHELPSRAAEPRESDRVTWRHVGVGLLLALLWGGYIGLHVWGAVEFF